VHLPTFSPSSSLLFALRVDGALPVMDVVSLLNSDFIDVDAVEDVLQIPASALKDLPNAELPVTIFAHEYMLPQDNSLIFANPVEGLSELAPNGDPIRLSEHRLPSQIWLDAALKGLHARYTEGVRFRSFADPCCKDTLWPLWVLQWWDDYSRLLARQKSWRPVLAALSSAIPDDAADVKAAREMLGLLSFGGPVKVFGAGMLVDDFQKLLVDGTGQGQLNDSIIDLAVGYLEHRVDCTAAGVIFARRGFFDKLEQGQYDDPLVLRYENLIKQTSRPRTHLASVAHVIVGGQGHWVPFRLGFKRLQIQYGTAGTS
jgi:hypothetical protein